MGGSGSDGREHRATKVPLIAAILNWAEAASDVSFLNSPHHPICPWEVCALHSNLHHVPLKGLHSIRIGAAQNTPPPPPCWRAVVKFLVNKTSPSQEQGLHKQVVMQGPVPAHDAIF